MLKFLCNLFKQDKKYRLYYFGGKKNKNAGDIFNVDLVEYFNIKYKRVRKIEKADLICVGSNLDKLFLPSKRKILVAGAGFIFPPSESDCIKREVEVLALRGELSKNRMENLLKKHLDDCPLADPGILVSKMYPQTLSKKYKAGIIPHCSDKELWNSDKIKINNYKLIDIQSDVKDVVREISECECILSSSLHGLIFADSYGIPNRQLIMSDKIAGGSYKFKDYYSAYGEELPESIDLRKTVIDDDTIKNVISSYSVKDIEAKQNELVGIFEAVGEGNG